MLSEAEAVEGLVMGCVGGKVYWDVDVDCVGGCGWI